MESLYLMLANIKFWGLTAIFFIAACILTISFQLNAPPQYRRKKTLVMIFLLFVQFILIWWLK